MELPLVRCTSCGKAFKINEGIMDNGKAFCSEECQKSSNTVEAQ